MTNQEILNQAIQLDAVSFATFLDENKINYIILECNIMDYNDDYFNIDVEGFESGDYFLFLNGKFQN